jgi:PIN domain nuclease of toxin-antitoxin system
MKNQVVLDTSAVLALLAMEEGHEVVAENLENAVVSSVNLSEVITVLVRRGLKHEDVAQSLKDTFPQIEEFNAAQAIVAARLDEVTKAHGLSFGDRACLALAKSKNLVVLTTDEVWKELELGIEVQLIRFSK